MAIENRYPINKPLITSLPFEPPAFQRNKKAIKLKTKLTKKTLPAKQIAIFFLGIIAFFFLGAESYYYAITCEQLKIKQVQVFSSSPELRTKVENFLSTRNLGNILICNLDYLRTSLSQIPGVKEVRLQKVLPSTLKVEAFPRIPRAYVHKDIYYLVDEEGQVISSVAGQPDESFPILEDEKEFREAYSQKVATACQALADLQPEVRARIKKITFQDNETMELELSDDPTKIITDESSLSNKLNYYLSHRDSWAQLFGQLEYVDLRIEDRVYLKPLIPAGENISTGKKEAS
ncbi:MAG TPA: hypothetical protein ENO29_04795 [Candidatus Aminicenantes bacterium]|nr:MAG: hypothetical protein C0168_11230 [Candidatus Aminicenantes bacterium]HEK85653.1 hypothetical protein [Candidatus Aminicenantes bacterium]